MPPDRVQHLPDRPVGRDRVLGWHDRPEPQPPVGVGAEPGTQHRTVHIGQLDVVEAVLIGLPDIDDRIGNGDVVRVSDADIRPQGNAGKTGGEIGAL